MKTLKELADIGAKAAADNIIDGLSISVSVDSRYWQKEEPARQAFAAAVRDAVLADLVTKPTWKLPDPPEGREWHRQDWTEEMLPDGYRPLLLNEVLQEEADSFLVNSYPLKFEIVKGLAGDAAHRGDQHRRTTRPLPPITKTIPLTMDDIRATDEFRHVNEEEIQIATSWRKDSVWLFGHQRVTLQLLSRNYLRRQLGSNEWKPCTKEITL